MSRYIRPVVIIGSKALRSTSSIIDYAKKTYFMPNIRTADEIEPYRYKIPLRKSDFFEVTKPKIKANLIDRINVELEKAYKDWPEICKATIAMSFSTEIPNALKNKIVYDVISTSIEHSEEVFETLVRFLSKGGVRIKDAVDEAGNRPLYKAAICGTPNEVELLLKLGSDPTVESFGDNPYRVAASRAIKDEETGLKILELLIKNKMPSKEVVSDVHEYLMCGSSYLEEKALELIGKDFEGESEA